MVDCIQVYAMFINNLFINIVYNSTIVRVILVKINHSVSDQVHL